MKRILIIALMVSVTLFTCCSKTPKKRVHNTKQVQFTHLREQRVEVVNTVKHEGFIMGSNFEREEVYIQAISPLKRNYALLVVDIPSGDVKKEIQLAKGGFEGPREFYNPSYMEFVNGHYIIVDQYDKIMVYDEQLNYRYTNMFFMFRYFIDFFPMDNQLGFVIGERFIGMEISMNIIRLFGMKGNKKPQKETDLYAFKFKALGMKNRGNRKFRFEGSIWPSGRGFEKDGKIYFSNYNEQSYYQYDIKTAKTTAFSLDYIKEQTFSREEVEKLAYCYSDGTYARTLKRSGRRRAVDLPPCPMYHFGIFDAGKNKIGIISDLDIENFTFRLDVLDAVSGTYLESIRLPFGVGFTENISTSSRGQHHLYFDTDRGYYLWNDAEGEDLIYKTQITTFKILRQTESQNPAKTDERSVKDQ